MKGRFNRITNGYNYIKELWHFSFYYGINTLFDTKVVVVSYKETRIFFYQRVDKWRTITIFGKKIKEF